MNIYIVRHGETDWNIQGRLQGVSDIPLNVNGIASSIRLKPFFDGMCLQALITSPLKRTIMTGLLLIQDAQVDSYRLDERIIEKNYGICEGMIIQDRQALYPNGHSEGEESYKNVRFRMISALKDYRAQYDKDILVVSHGAAIAALMKELDPFYQTYYVCLNNNALTILDGDTLSIKAFNLSIEEALAWKGNVKNFD
ncbi:histidine phosphatase family protein [Absicoccus porci]|jgi:uncharacterized phosphatase|uniref:histidine phosphatase family protein n=1 Tax=Absicoccus porci TaxID=2486576 RepID=UPI003D904424